MQEKRMEELKKQTEVPTQENAAKEIPCYHCDGTKVGKTGRTCKKCSGSGVMNSQCMAEILKLIKNEISSSATIAFNKLQGKEPK